MIGKTLDNRYQILEELGQGGFAIVHRGLDTALNRQVALKELRPMLLQDESWVSNFRREARTIAQLDHPHIVSIYDIHETDQHMFIVMRLVQGPSLESLLNEHGRLSWLDALKLIIPVAHALDYAHRQQVLHRDLKPANILIDSERGPMLSDFGLAWLSSAGRSWAGIGSSGSVVGTPHYIAPEVWEGQPATPRSDLYALGCILFEMLTSEKLFPGETPLEVMRSHFEPLELPDTWPDDVPPEIQPVLGRALSANPADRWGNAANFAAALTELTTPAPVTIPLPAQSRHPKESATKGLQLNSPILSTKLYSALNRTNLVSRPRLTLHISNAVQAGCQLTLVSAPAGFGKSTLISCWLQWEAEQAAVAGVPPLKSAWLSLDEADNDPSRFLTYVVAALQTIQPNLADSILQIPQLPPPETLATLLINELTSLSDPFVLVLDDFHVISTGYIHQFIEFVLTHQPPYMHLVITTREDPPLPIARLRARGHAIEIRQDELRFTALEAATFLNQAMGLNLTPTAVQALEMRTEGWIAGLQLAALSLQGRDALSVTDFIEAFSGSHRYVIDYLVEEVIVQQPNNIRQFLRQTSILDRLSAPLCNAVTEQISGKLILGYLEQINMFLIPLDDERRWYRYHHLFAEFLQTELTSPEKETLHLRAASWFERHGYYNDAVKHLLAAENHPEAARLISQVADETLRRGAFITLAGWLEALPASFLRNNSQLAVIRGWVEWLLGDVESAGSYLASARENLPDDASPALRGKLISLEACLSVSRETTGIELAQKAIPLLEETDPFFTGMALLVLGEAQNLMGDTTSAVETLHQVLRLGRTHNDYFMMIGALTNLAQQLNWQGQRQQAEAMCHEAVKLSFDDRGQKRPMAGFSYITLAEMELHAGNLDSTFQHLMHGLELTKKFAMAGFEISGKLVLGPLQHAMGQSEAALKTLHEIVHVVVDGAYTSYAGVSLALEADMRLKCGDIAGAAEWAATITPPQPGGPPLSLMKEIEYMAYARYLLASNQVDAALQLLDTLEKSALQGGRGLVVLGLRLVRVRALAAQKRIEQAQEQLALAVKQAAPENYSLVFWQDGPEVAQLLPAVRHLAPEFVDSVMTAAAERYRLELMQPAAPAPSAAGAPSLADTLIEPLTEREIEVLQLIAEGQSNKEAAETLVVTVGTVKKHLSNIFGKLGVNSRTQAIARAREMRVI